MVKFLNGSVWTIPFGVLGRLLTSNSDRVDCGRNSGCVSHAYLWTDVSTANMGLTVPSILSSTSTQAWIEGRLNATRQPEST